MTTPATSDSSNSLYEALEKYNWDDDAEFQSGLSAILGSNSTPEQAAELTLRARCFYYSRKYSTNVDFDAYKAYRASHPSRPLTSNGVPPSSNSSTFNPSNSTSVPFTPSAPSDPATTDSASGILPNPATPNEPPAPYPTSFAHIVELVTTGQPIPGIKEIPNTVLTGQGTAGVRPKRRKPWEKDGESEREGVQVGGEEAST
ncbi:hypothetical protein BDV96DRAFT_684384 [Lophiotrema nucula]|uniref:Uncharacterized protein n=1 Tax=Lophiotrema nucula TaxID=690887 RepID=A0A6A5ZIN8_9PLEO|nr:hypothetical protein BDV96DRAFT_684384 [Lophiotrema nucula]